MKETPEKHPEFDPETYTDPILEECYRIKAEISAQTYRSRPRRNSQRTLCTPIALMEDIQMKEKQTPEKYPEFDPETYTNPILEEYYRIKAEISAQFKTQEEFFAYLKAGEEEDKRNGLKYVPYDPSKHTPPEKPMTMTNHKQESGRTNGGHSDERNPRKAPRI